MILKTMEVGSILVNCYIVADEETKEAAVFDPGGHVPRILEILAEDDLKTKYIINTHAHFDHVGGNQELRDKTGAPILIHRDEGPGLLAAGERAALYGLTGMPSKADRFIEEGDTLEIGSIHFEIMELRGHSYTGLGFLFEGEIELDEVRERRQILISGDILFAGSIGRTDFPGGNLEVILENIRTKIFTLPDETLVLSGHGPVTTVGQEKRYNPFLRDPNWT